MKPLLIEELIRVNPNYITEMEMMMETELILFLSIMKIYAVRNEDENRKKLKFKNEITTKFQHSIFLSSLYNLEFFYRKIFKQLLNEDVFNLKFYIHVEFDDKVIIHSFRYSVRKIELQEG